MKWEKKKKKVEEQEIENGTEQNEKKKWQEKNRKIEYIEQEW